MAEKPIVVTGTLAGAGAEAKYLNVVALRGNVVLARAPLRDDGSYRLTLPAEAARAKSAYALHVAAVPVTAVDHVDRVPSVPRVALAPEALAQAEVKAPALSVSDQLLKNWGVIFWPEWCVSGTLVGPNGCPVPAAQVTVYNVTWTAQGYVKNAMATVTTGADGTFTLCFPWWKWLFCWPCTPWWLCWPWWWEEDILHVIAALEARQHRAGNALALFQPESHALLRGQGFPSARVGPAAPDSARTALITRKLGNPALRELFPWHWWCCWEPNIVFSATQAGTTILDEDPAINTRWCMQGGQNVTLTGNAATLTTCNTGTPPQSGVLWTSVGNTTIGSIDANGCAQYSGDATDVAFAGTLSLFAASALGAFDYYQVQAAVWNKPAFQTGATKPASGSGTPVIANLWQVAWIYDPATQLVTQHSVQMGPFSQNGIDGLYATPTARQNLAAPPGLAAFPTVPPGGQVFWQYEIPELMLQCDASVLLGGALFGSVDLTIVGYKNPTQLVSLTPDDPLTLTIDATPLTTFTVGTPQAFTDPLGQNPASNTGSGQCPAYDVGPNGLVKIPVTVMDTNGFLFGYHLEADWGNSNSTTVDPPMGYAANKTAPYTWTGGSYTYIFPGTTTGIPVPPADCCYEFRLWFGKRVTNGWGGPSLTDLPPTFQTINLKFSS
jgi:hypothetical protein